MTTGARRAPARFEPAVLESVANAYSLGVRSGDTHKHTNVWVVVIEGRVLVRSWNNKPTGWFSAFRKQPVGSIVLKGKSVPARGIPVRSVALIAAVTAAFASKYQSKGMQKYVEGFRDPKRGKTTLEFVPA